MAETDNTTQGDVKLTQDWKEEIRGADCISQANSELIDVLSKTIQRLTDDKEIIAIAKHIQYLSDDSMNVVNAAAEGLGANYV